MRILVLSYWWLYPADNGARMRGASLLHELAKTHEVHLISFTQEAISTEQREAARRIFASVVDMPQQVWRPKPFEQIASLWKKTPASVRATFNPQIDVQIQEIAAKLRPDVVLTLTNHMIPYARHIPGVRRAVDDLEVTNILDAYRRAPLRKRFRNWLTWYKLQSYIRDLLHSFDLCTVASLHEKDHIQRLAPPGVQVEFVPNGALLEDSLPSIEPEPDTLIYPGALSFSANLNAMQYFLQEIFPAIRRQRPGVRLRITGKTTDEQRKALPSIEGVEFLGYVPDIRTAVASAWAEVVPLREGGGTRLKILEALALGTPVVATTKGAEGLDLIHGRDLLIADAPEMFAEATLRILRDHELRADLGRNGRKAVQERYDWRIIGQHYAQLISQIGASVAHDYR